MIEKSAEMALAKDRDTENRRNRIVGKLARLERKIDWYRSDFQPHEYIARRNANSRRMQRVLKATRTS